MVVVVRGHCEKRAVTLKELQIAKKINKNEREKV